MMKKPPQLYTSNCNNCKKEMNECNCNAYYDDV